MRKRKRKEKEKERGRMSRGRKRCKGVCEVGWGRIAQGQPTTEEVVYKCLHNYIYSSLQKAEPSHSFLECELKLVTWLLPNKI